MLTSGTSLDFCTISGFFSVLCIVMHKNIKVDVETSLIFRTITLPVYLLYDACCVVWLVPSDLFTPFTARFNSFYWPDIWHVPKES